MKCAVRRFFVLNNEAGLLEYFVNEQSRPQKPRGMLPLAGAVISPSDEDSHTFTVNAISGEQYKLRGAQLLIHSQTMMRNRLHRPHHVAVLTLEPTLRLCVSPIHQTTHTLLIWMFSTVCLNGDLCS